MRTEREPSARDIRILVEFLPKLYGEGTPPPVMRWNTEGKDGTLTLPWPEYNETVESFIDLIESQGFWMVDSYIPEEVEKLLMDKEAVKVATLPEIRRMFTLVVRGERFCSGWWSLMIEDGHMRRLLERLAEIGAER